MELDDLFDFIGNPALATAATAISAVIAALIIHAIVSAIVGRIIAHRPYANAFLRGSIAPLRLLLPSLAVQAVLAAMPKDLEWLSSWRHAVLLASIIGATWLAVNMVFGMRDVVKLRFPADSPDNLSARRVLTQSTVLMRTLAGVIILIGTAIALMTFPGVRQIGASMLASAGLAGLVVGFAAKPVLGNLIAGLQIAMAQPIRIDDVVIVEGEWGRIEEITGAFVVVKIWDERRLVVPLQWFIEHPFQNWTRTGSQIIGSVIFWVDYRMPLDPLRKELERVCKSSTEWDGRFCVLQVTDTSERAMQLRALVTAQDAGRAWDLRCRVREALIALMQREYTHALPHVRAEMMDAAPGHKERTAGGGAQDDKATAVGRATPEAAQPPPPAR